MAQHFLALNEIKNLQLDHTTSCNLMCPQCSRVVNGQRKPLLPIAELTPADYTQLLDQLVTPLETLLFCGNYGDVAASNTFLDSLRAIKQRTSAKITLMSNGSVRTKDWWQTLATVLDPQRDKVCFSIDGLKDTNSLYRVNSQFDKIIENAKAFINNGGRARWDFIAFQHNEHQIEEAQKLATSLGFYMFSLKRTSRFIKDNHFRESTSYTKTEAKLDIPSNPNLVSVAHKNFDGILKKHESWNNYVQETPINCKFKSSQTLFIDFNLQVWPCTWIAAPLYFFEESSSQKKQLLKVLDQFPQNFNSLRHHKLSEILNSTWYKSLLVESWGKNHPERLTTCGRTCGVTYDYSASTKNNRDFILLNKESRNVF
ncbi:MAG: radical SAM protein [Bdellovibrionaceae bacterium]|nr:radical SAM protein [Pseudobdellovibrionaceae bacterium]